MNGSEDRFINIENWYVYQEKIWNKTYLKKIITKLENIIH
jgi:hypothetical protein